MNKVQVVWGGVLAIFAVIYLWSCTTPVESSAEPGIVRITLQSDQSDTTAIVVDDTFSVSPQARFPLTLFQGRAYNDSNYALLFPSLDSYLTEDVQVNILALDTTSVRYDTTQITADSISVDTSYTFGYHKFTIYESFVPPGEYDSLEVGLTGNAIRFGGFEFIRVELPPEVNSLMTLHQEFEVFEHDTTEINMIISPFKSISRYRDTFRFVRQVRIESVKHYN